MADRPQYNNNGSWQRNVRRDMSRPYPNTYMNTLHNCYMIAIQNTNFAYWQLEHYLWVQNCITWMQAFLANQSRPSNTPSNNPLCNIRAHCNRQHNISPRGLLVPAQDAVVFCRDYKTTGCRTFNCKYIHATDFEEKLFHNKGCLPMFGVAHLHKISYGASPPPAPPQPAFPPPPPPPQPPIVQFLPPQMCNPCLPMPPTLIPYLLPLPLVQSATSSHLPFQQPLPFLPPPPPPTPHLARLPHQGPLPSSSPPTGFYHFN